QIRTNMRSIQAREVGRYLRPTAGNQQRPEDSLAVHARHSQRSVLIATRTPRHCSGKHNDNATVAVPAQEQELAQDSSGLHSHSQPDRSKKAVEPSPGLIT